MIESEYDEQIKSFKDSHVAFITDMVKEIGGTTPMLTIFCLNINPKEHEKPFTTAIFEVPEFLMNDNGKDLLAKVVFPTLIKKMKSDATEPLCICFSSEAWIRVAPKDEFDRDNWRDLSKTEGLLFSFETPWSVETRGFNMERVGKKVTEGGTTIDDIQLTPRTELDSLNKMQGRFSNLFCQFREQEN